MVQEAPPEEWWMVFLENLLLWLSVYSVAYMVIYLEPSSSIFRPFKFNPQYPERSMVLREFFRSVRGVLICSLMEVVTGTLFKYKYLPSSLCLTWMCETAPRDLKISSLLFIFVLLYLWGDMHFYWTHRMLHTRWLYKRVHKEHHQSYNPDPFAGLSMHWFESMVYFSAALFLSVCSPFWIVRLLYKALLIFPLEGHSGHGTWKIESSHNHYIHHAKFNWNFGSSPLWDKVMRTHYPKDVDP